MNKDILNESIHILHLPGMAQGALMGAKINTIRQLVSMNMREVTNLRGMGRTGIASIESALGEHGLHIGMDLETMERDHDHSDKVFDIASLLLSKIEPIPHGMMCQTMNDVMDAVYIAQKAVKAIYESEN